MDDEIHRNKNLTDFVAFLILVRSMIRSSGVVIISPEEAHVLNHLAVNLFNNDKMLLFELIKNIPEMQNHAIKVAIKGLYQKELIEFELIGSATKVTLTEKAIDYLSKMGACVFHASSEIIEI